MRDRWGEHSKRACKAFGFTSRPCLVARIISVCIRGGSVSMRKPNADRFVAAIPEAQIGREARPA